MTVNELISRLQALSEEEKALPVIVEAYDYFDVEDVYCGSVQGDKAVIIA